MRPIDADKVDFNEVFVGASDFARDTREAAQMLIDAQPTIEAVPVVKAHWHSIYTNNMGAKVGFCSNCGHQKEVVNNYCGNCGADMKGGAE